MEENRQMIRANGQSFLIEIKCTQNSTWQGVITWVEKKQSLPFRSVLEMIRLMDSAMASGAVLPGWE
ncbi:MAG: hypothetical protein PHG16_06245 [Lachnospiraceae bacterium]|nr:hypothetical protein [Lachnospiraceae bacterium]